MCLKPPEGHGPPGGLTVTSRITAGVWHAHAARVPQTQTGQNQARERPCGGEGGGGGRGFSLSMRRNDGYDSNHGQAPGHVPSQGPAPPARGATAASGGKRRRGPRPAERASLGTAATAPRRAASTPPATCPKAFTSMTTGRRPSTPFLVHKTCSSLRLAGVPGYRSLLAAWGTDVRRSRHSWHNLPKGKQSDRNSAERRTRKRSLRTERRADL